MDSSLIISIISLIISSFAVTFTFIELWKNNFSQFKPLILTGDLRLRVYPITNKKEKWYIPSLDIPLNIANEAACPGKVLSIRIVVQYPKLPIQNNKEIFYPQWEVDAGEFNRLGRDRFEWIEKAVINDWMPFIVLSKTSLSKHLIFEIDSSWETPVIQQMLFTMEIFTLPENKWRQIGKWEYDLSVPIWRVLTQLGSSILIGSTDADEIEKDKIYPSDLHKYTGTDIPIPEGDLNLGISYLDFPSKKSKDAKTSQDKSES